MARLGGAIDILQSIAIGLFRHRFETVFLLVIVYHSAHETYLGRILFAIPLRVIAEDNPTLTALSISDGKSYCLSLVCMIGVLVFVGNIHGISVV
jgi:hypothetical protein